MEARGPEVLDDIVAGLEPREANFTLDLWDIRTQHHQWPPETDDWLVWLLLGGRGAGKTLAGAHWIRGAALGLPPYAGEAVRHIALVGETLADVREVMIEGVSGLLSVHPRDERPQWIPARRLIVWPNGSRAYAFSAEDPESLRGPQFGAAWSDGSFQPYSSPKAANALPGQSSAAL